MKYFKDVLENKYNREVKEIKLLDELFLLDSRYYQMKQDKIDELATMLSNNSYLFFTILELEFCTSISEYNSFEDYEKEVAITEVNEFLSSNLESIIDDSKLTDWGCKI